MSINTTPYLHLPQWTADEQPSFLGEINQAWASIDTGYGDIKTTSETAITAANNAVNIANSANQQSQANAGQITQLQQQLAQLQADFASAGTLISDTPVITSTIDGITINSYYASHNKYTAQIGFYIILAKAKTYESFIEKPICNISGLPYIWKTINATIGETIGPVTGIETGGMNFFNAPGCTIKANGDVVIGIGEVVTTVENSIAIDVTFSIPIYQAVDRENIPDNCAVLL